MVHYDASIHYHCNAVAVEYTKHAPNYMRNIRAKQAVKAYKTQSTLVTIAKVPGGTRLQNS